MKPFNTKRRATLLSLGLAAAFAGLFSQGAAAQEVGEIEAERLMLAESPYEDLNRLVAAGLGGDLPEAVIAPTYNETAYRLSLLSLLGDAEAALEKSVVADIVKIPLRLEASSELFEPDHPEVASISQGRLTPLAPKAGAKR